MTSSFKAALVLVWSAALVLPVSVLSQASVMQRGDLTVEARKVVNDVVVADGDLIVRGKVTGSIFVSGGDVSLEPGSRVGGNLTVLGGSLWVAKGADISGEINILSGKAHIEKGAVTGAQVRAIENVSSLSDEKLSLVSRYIIFNRVIPPDTFSLDGLSGMDLRSLRLRQLRRGSPVALDLFELGRLPLELDHVRDATEMVFKNHDIRVRICVVRFDQDQAVERFWEKLRLDYEDIAHQAVHNSLGEGAHFFFRHQGTSYCMWYKDTVFQAVMVRHMDDDPEEYEWERVEDVRDKVVMELKKKYSIIK